MTTSDYDGRTALHLAAAEGHEQSVRFLLETCKVPVAPKDRFVSTVLCTPVPTTIIDLFRWGHTPLMEAELFGFFNIVEILKKYQ